MRKKTALVVGGGIIGLATAFRLLREGLATTVVSQDDATKPASWGNAGHIAAEQVEPLASRSSIQYALRALLRRSGPISAPLRDWPTWAPFFLRVAKASGAARFRAGTAALSACMQRAIPTWRELVTEIGRPGMLIEDGHFVVWESIRSARRGYEAWSRTSIGPASFESATSDEMQQLAALIGKKPAGAIRFKGSGQVSSPGQLLQALYDAIHSAGGRFVSARAQALTTDASGRASIATDDRRSFTADSVVIAAGVDSGRLLRQSGSIVPIVAERGYHIQSPANGWPETQPPVVFDDRAMVVTRMLTDLRATGFFEFARLDRPPDPAKWKALEGHAAALGLLFREPVSRWMGARPTLPDYLPAIGRSVRARNLFYAFGHQHLGLTMAALTAEAIADLVADRSPAIDLRPFDVSRFS